jgi:Zn-dependent peptidase ImmA (M78 family)
VYGREVPPQSRANLRKLADTIRNVFGISNKRSFPVTEVLEWGMPQLFEDFGFEVCTHRELGDKHGETFPDKHLIRIREDVYERAIEGKGRDRFTVTHEISHLILLDEVALSYARKSQPTVGLPVFKDSEWQANALAGELLMPLGEIKQMDRFEISQRYGVTDSAVETQIRALRREGVL